MDQNERQQDKTLTIDKDAQINVIVNAPDGDEDTIDLGRVFHNMKIRSRIFAWVLVLCLLVGICAPVLMYVLNKPVLSVASVVTLKYDVATLRTVNGQTVISYAPVQDLTAPDGSPLDISLITSSYVLSQALDGMELSQPISMTNLRANISIERVLTDDSRRSQELAAKMTEDKNNGAYAQAQSVTLTYDCKFVVTLTNGFGEPDSNTKVYLTDEELRMLLDRILGAYNGFLVKTYANMKLPDDEISIIDTENLDLLECLDLLRTASDNLYAYCDNQPDDVKAYRSHRDGRNLYDWMQAIEAGREITIDYLYSYVYTNNIVRDRDTMVTNYNYQLRNYRTQLDSVNENVATVDTILENYKNDEVFVSMQESDASKATQTTTDYYNTLVVQQANNYQNISSLETKIVDLEGKIANLTDENTSLSEQVLAEAESELKTTIQSCLLIYNGVRAHMEEIMASPFYSDYAAHTVPQGKVASFLSANMKKIIIGGVAGLVIGCGIWFLAGLAPEFRRNRKEEGKEAAEA